MRRQKQKATELATLICAARLPNDTLANALLFVKYATNFDHDNCHADILFATKVLHGVHSAGKFSIELAVCVQVVATLALHAVIVVCVCVRVVRVLLTAIS